MPENSATASVVNLTEYSEQHPEPRLRSLPSTRSPEVDRAVGRLVDVLGEERIRRLGKLTDRQIRALTSVVPRDEYAEARDEACEDLATWPSAFRRRIRRLDDRGRWYDSPSLVDRFSECRSNPNRYPSGLHSGCGCGCAGLNSQLADALSRIRKYAAECTPRSRKPQEYMEEAKAHVLTLLWLSGTPKVDRKALAQHSAEEAEMEIEELQDELRRTQTSIEYYTERLRDGTYSKPKKKRGQPLSPVTRAGFQASLLRAEAKATETLERIARGRALLDDPHARVRKYTGCARTATA